MVAAPVEEGERAMYRLGARRFISTRDEEATCWRIVAGWS